MYARPLQRSAVCYSGMLHQLLEAKVQGWGVKVVAAPVDEEVG